MKSSNPSSGGCVSKLKVLADQTRLAVLEALMQRSMHVNELVEALHVEQSLLSHHLRVLRDAELVVCHREGQSVVYELAADTKQNVQGKGIDLGCCQISF